MQLSTAHSPTSGRFLLSHAADILPVLSDSRKHQYNQTILQISPEARGGSCVILSCLLWKTQGEYARVAIVRHVEYTAHDNNHSFFVMKSILAISSLLAAIAVSACQPSLPLVPDSGRKVVGPQGSTRVEKTWNRPNQAEGDAALGPLSNARR